MQKHNILGKKAEASAALKERIITFVAWIFIIFCICVVFYFSKIGLKSLFLTSNKHFTLENIEIKVENLSDESDGLVNLEKLEKHLDLKIGTDNIFEIDLKKVQNKALENIAIESAKVSYAFPDTINVDITEKRPVAQVNDGFLVTPTLVKNKKCGYFLYPANTDFELPIIRIHPKTAGQFRPGTVSSSDHLNIPLNLILFNETFRMNYTNAKAVLGKTEFASMEVIGINSVSMDNQNSLKILLKENKKLWLPQNARLTILADEIEMGLRRACIAIIENARVRKPTSKIDARYSSTSTE